MKSTRSMTTDEKNAMAAMPNALTTDDGRRLRIRSWAPVVDMSGYISVTVEGFMDTVEPSRKTPRDE